MNPWMEGVRRVLVRAPMGALALSGLLKELRYEGLGTVPDPGRLLQAVLKRSDQFRVFRLTMGPWSSSRSKTRRGGGWECKEIGDPWILLLRNPDAGFGPGQAVGRRIQVGLLEWGRHVDEASPASVARWLRASRQGAKAWSVLVSGLPQEDERRQTTTPRPDPLRPGIRTPPRRPPGPHPAPPPGYR